MNMITCASIKYIYLSCTADQSQTNAQVYVYVMRFQTENAYVYVNVLMIQADIWISIYLCDEVPGRPMHKYMFKF